MKILLKAMKTKEDVIRFMKFCQDHEINTFARSTGNHISLGYIDFENERIKWGGSSGRFQVSPALFSYFKLKYPDGDPPRGQSFANVKMVISGKFSKLDEEQVTATVTAKGGQVVSAVNKTVNLLVLGKKPNAKLVQKAESLGQVVILDEERFAALLPAPRSTPKTVDRQSLSNLKKLLLSRDTDRIQQGIELLRSLDSVDLYDHFLAGLSVDEEGGLVLNSIFKGDSSLAQPYLNIALLGVIAHAPRECEVAATLRKSVTHLKMDLLSTEPLAALPNLVSIDLCGSSGLETLEGLGQLKKLKTLKISQCFGLKNVDGLASCAKLENLDASSSSQLKNIDGVAGCTRLKTLSLNDIFGLQNVDGLSQHTTLVELDLYRCEKLVNVDAIAGCTHLKRLDLGRCESIESIEGLRSMTRLAEFTLSADVPDVDALAGCTSLAKVNLSGCKQLRDLSGLGGCTKLKTLDLSSCGELASIDSLANCTKLTHLDLVGCRSLINLDALRKCKNLESSNPESEDWIGHTKGFDLTLCDALENVEGLAGCKKITEVTFSAPDRASLPRGFEEIPNLRKLRLERNPHLVNVDGLAGCNKLQEVVLQDCESLTNVAGLVGCSELSLLDLGGCKQVRPKPKRRELRTREEVADYLARVEKAVLV